MTTLPTVMEVVKNVGSKVGNIRDIDIPFVED